ncbi:MAG TPA: hypothetical protein VNN20_15400 [Thermodesulfobacteriota bacterium]|nr:hypothetical protein [Thermodesulfobacteriota bacterium]
MKVRQIATLGINARTLRKAKEMKQPVERKTRFLRYSNDEEEG